MQPSKADTKSSRRKKIENTYDYDAEGNLIGITDTAGRIVTKEDAFGIRTAYSYDVSDRVIELVNAQGTKQEQRPSIPMTQPGTIPVPPMQKTEKQLQRMTCMEI